MAIARKGRRPWLTPVENPSATGCWNPADGGWRVQKSLKPDEITPNNINGGTYILEPRVPTICLRAENIAVRPLSESALRSRKLFRHIQRLLD